MMLADSMRVDGEAARIRDRLAALSARQREVVELVAEGRSNREIAKALFLSEAFTKPAMSAPVMRRYGAGTAIAT